MSYYEYYRRRRDYWFEKKVQCWWPRARARIIYQIKICEKEMGMP